LAYILKHWRGQLSLAVSFWVNVFIINIGIRVFEFWLTETSPIENPVLSSQFTITYVFIALAIVYPWQIIGLWRSANRSIEKTKKRFWPGAVKVLVVLGLLGTFGDLSTSWPDYKDLYRIGFEKDECGDCRVEVMNDGSLIHLKGGLGFGVSTEVRRLLDKNQNVNGIILDSLGGRVYEGRELSKLILIHGLDTYTLKGCYSACVTAFISGNRRYLADGANLAFHQYNSGRKGLEQYADMSSEQQKDLKIYEQRGVSQDFVDRMFTAKHDDLWFPTVDEMIAAGVIHAVVNPSTLKPMQYASLGSSEIEHALRDISAFQTVKKYEPHTYRQIINEMDAQMKKGASILEIQQAVGGYMDEIASKALPITSDQALIAFARETISVLGMLEKKEPILCMKYIFSEHYGALDITQHVSNAKLMPMIDALSMVIADSYQSASKKSIDIAAAEELMSRVVMELGDDVSYMDGQGLKNREEYSKACNTIISFYELILRNNKKAAGNGLRYVFSP